MKKLTPAMIEALEFAIAQEDGCVKIKHHATVWALKLSGFIKSTSGYGYKFGEIHEITEEGRKALMEMKRRDKSEINGICGKCTCK